MEHRAHSLLHVKSVVSEERREITGFATTPSPDRVGDIVDPYGATFAKDLPLLWQHNHSAPVGRVKFGKATSKGIPFTATIAKIDEAGALKDRTDEAWQSVKSGLVTGVSIGFRPLDGEVTRNKSGGVTFKSTEIFELSLVTIPANAQATIETIKSLDHEAEAASGTVSWTGEGQSSTASGKETEATQSKSKGVTTMSYSAQIEQFTKSIAAKQEEASAMLQKSIEEGVTFNEEEEKQYDELNAEVKSLEKHVARLQEQVEKDVTTAQPVDVTKSTAGVKVVSNKKELPKGIQFARYAKCIAAAQGNYMQAANLANKHYGDSPAIAHVFEEKAAGTTSDAAWAAPLVQESDMVGEFIELLRARTVMGRLEGFRNVPFNVRVPRQTGSSTASWVGEGAQKPNSELAFDTVSLSFAKVAGIVPVTMELLQFSNPSVDGIIQNDLIQTIARLIDDTFLDPTVAATASSPASVLNGVTPVANTGVTAEAYEADLASLVEEFTSANLSLSGSYFLMSETRAFRMAQLKNLDGTRTFEGMSMMATGGSRNIYGIPVITTEADVMQDQIVLIKPSEILVASDGGIDIDVSREASITLNGTLTSAWENNLVLTRAERMITWEKARPQAASYIDYSTP